MRHSPNQSDSFCQKHNQSSQGSTKRIRSLYVPSTHVKHVSLMEITGTVPLPNSTPVFHTKNLFMFPSTHVKHVSLMEITESTRGKKPHNTHAFLLPTFSFCTHPPRPLFMGVWSVGFRPEEWGRKPNRRPISSGWIFPVLESAKCEKNYMPLRRSINLNGM